MARVVWDRREDIKAAIDTIPAKVQGSLKDFRPPPTIESDFRRLLSHDVPHVNFTFELVRDWYQINGEDYEPIYIRAQQTPIDWKSKIGNSDMSINFKVTHDIPIHKGDIRSNIEPALIAIAAPIVLLLIAGIPFCSRTSFNIPPKIGSAAVRKQISSGSAGRTFALPQTGQFPFPSKAILHFWQYTVIPRFLQYRPIQTASFENWL